jgi:hypothetical protein
LPACDAPRQVILASMNGVAAAELRGVGVHRPGMQLPARRPGCAEN